MEENSHTTLLRQDGWWSCTETRLVIILHWQSKRIAHSCADDNINQYYTKTAKKIQQKSFNN